MAEVPQWRVAGDWFDVCKCRVPCPCTFAQPPTEDERQREALQVIFGGQAGGWPGEFVRAALGELRGVEFAPIDIEVAEDLGRWRLDAPGKARIRAEALAGPTTPPGKRVQVHNAGGSEVGPGAVATYAVATEDEANALGFAFAWPGRSSKHMRFEWSGPDEG